MSDGDHGSNVQLDYAHDLANEMRKVKGWQETTLAEAKKLVKAIPGLKIANLEKRQECPIGKATGPMERKAEQDFYARESGAELQEAELLLEFQYKALSTLESTMTSLQSRAKMLGIQAHGDGRGR